MAANQRARDRADEKDDILAWVFSAILAWLSCAIRITRALGHAAYGLAPRTGQLHDAKVASEAAMFLHFRYSSSRQTRNLDYRCDERATRNRQRRIGSNLESKVDSSGFAAKRRWT